ncbi:MAG: hypothetical protein B0A82_08365 [Alkalinema sp. CACIAM 70d]|nr:MAG: hypothetical protein B0A82_08365 [Alkalinema sp. CACIAM 70d]
MRSSADCENIIFSNHAIQQMFLRRIDRGDIKAVIAYGEIIEETPDDEPFPSYLILDFVKGRPVHVVISQDVESQICYVVTAYEPNISLWKDNFSKRK